jgi:hypothetical protein
MILYTVGICSPCCQVPNDDKLGHTPLYHLFRAYGFQRIVNLIPHVGYSPFDDVTELLGVDIEVRLPHDTALVFFYLVLTIPAIIQHN